MKLPYEDYIVSKKTGSVTKLAGKGRELLLKFLKKIKTICVETRSLYDLRQWPIPLAQISS